MLSPKFFEELESHDYAWNGCISPVPFASFADETYQHNANGYSFSSGDRPITPNNLTLYNLSHIECSSSHDLLLHPHIDNSNSTSLSSYQRHSGVINCPVTNHNEADDDYDDGEPHRNDNHHQITNSHSLQSPRQRLSSSTNQYHAHSHAGKGLKTIASIQHTHATPYIYKNNEQNQHQYPYHHTHIRTNNAYATPTPTTPHHHQQQQINTYHTTTDATDKTIKALSANQHTYVSNDTINNDQEDHMYPRTVPPASYRTCHKEQEEPDHNTDDYQHNHRHSYGHGFRKSSFENEPDLSTTSSLFERSYTYPTNTNLHQNLPSRNQDNGSQATQQQQQHLRNLTRSRASSDLLSSSSSLASRTTGNNTCHNHNIEAPHTHSAERSLNMYRSNPSSSSKALTRLRIPTPPSTINRTHRNSAELISTHNENKESSFELSFSSPPVEYIDLSENETKEAQLCYDDSNSVGDGSNGVINILRTIRNHTNLLINEMRKTELFEDEYEEAVLGIETFIMELLNQCWVYVPSQLCILVVRDIHNGKILDPLVEYSESKFKCRYKDQNIQFPTLTKTGQLNLKRRYLTDMWLDSNRRLKANLIFDPSQNVDIYNEVDKLSGLNWDTIETDTFKLNTFCGFKISLAHSISYIVRQGLDASTYYDCCPIIRHIWEISASKNQKTYDYIMNWFASVVQFRKKIGTVLVFTGQQRCGKGTILRCMRKIIGEKHFYLIQNLQRNCNFTSSLKECLLAHVDEANNFKGNAYQIYKSIVTDTNMEVTEQHKKSSNMDTFTNFAMCMNNVKFKMETNETRFIFINVSSAKLNEPSADREKYFKILENAPVEIFAHYLYKRNIGNWNPEDRNLWPPYDLTQFMQLDQISKFWLHCFQQKYILSKTTRIYAFDGLESCDKKIVFASFCKFPGTTTHEKYDGIFWKRSSKYICHRTRCNSDPRRVVFFPIDKCKKIFCEEHGAGSYWFEDYEGAPRQEQEEQLLQQQTQQQQEEDDNDDYYESNGIEFVDDVSGSQ